MAESLPAARYDAIVIGAGPNGLTAARVLARRRRRVLVVDSADEVGGHTRSIEFAPGFRSPLSEDTGWVPPAVAKLFALDKLQKAGGAVSTTVMGPDRQTLHLPARVPAAVQRIAQLSPRDADRWPAFVERLQKFATMLEVLYQLVPPDIDAEGPRELMPIIGLGRKLRAMGRADLTEFLRIVPMSIQDLLDDTFENDLLKAAVAAAAVRDLRQGPRSGGTTFNLLHYMVGASAGSIRGRSWYLAAPDAFARHVSEALKKRKVHVMTGTHVARIMIANDEVTGVRLSTGEEIEAPLVISTADPKRTLLDLVDPVWLDPELVLAARNIKMRGCTAFVFYAVERAVDDAAKSFTASVSLTPSTAGLERAADAAKYGQIAPEPHVEIFSPTLRWPQLAPEFKHVVTARVHYAPYALRDGEWDAKRCDALEKKVTAMMSRIAPTFEPTIIHRAVLSPRDVEERFGVTEGALSHGELMLDQMLFMRPVPGWGRYYMPVRGLFLGGAGAHPGPSVLGGAGYLAAKATGA